MPCTKCPYSYVGETKRALDVRMGEHKKDIDNKRKKVVPLHCRDGHNIDWNNVSILHSEQNFYKRHNVSEMLFINMQKAPIHKKEDTKSLHNSYVSLIRKLTHIYNNKLFDYLYCISI